jgi:hypothetical protein
MGFGPGLATHKYGSLHAQLLLHPPGLAYSFRPAVQHVKHAHAFG